MRQQRTLTLGLIAGVAVWATMCKSDPTQTHQPPGAPAVDAGVDMTAETGRTVPFVARITPPKDVSATEYHWTLAWGDGTVDSGVFDASGTINTTHTYAGAGQFPLKLGARAPGSTDSGSDAVTVNVDAPGTPQVFIGAGDIGECSKVHSSKTAAVVAATPGTVFTLGDNAYPSGTLSDFTNTSGGVGCWASTWGQFKKRIHPTPGNHEFQEYSHDSTGDGYFGYFGVAAHTQPIGDYSYDVGAWHIIVLNSSFLESEPAGRALNIQTQLAWLSADLAAHPATCTLAMWHHPHFSAGVVHSDPAETQATKPFWDTLYAHGADVILSGHEHNYQRFAPQTPDGTADLTNGIRQFVAGTGGGGYDTLANPITQPNTEASTTEHGVLKLTLSPGSYHWEFIPTSGPLGEIDPSTFTFTDSGTASCH